MSPMEARYHRLDWREVALGTRTVRTIAGPVLCGCGSCGDVLATVTMTTDAAGALVWVVAVQPGYSEVTPGTWRWSRHAQRSYRGAGHDALRNRIGEAGRIVYTARGDEVVIWPQRTRVFRGEGADIRRRAGVLGADASLTIGCQQASPHVSRVSYEGLMRQVVLDARLEPA